jgi:hypothetical protein
MDMGLPISFEEFAAQFCAIHWVSRLMALAQTQLRQNGFRQGHAQRIADLSGFECGHVGAPSWGGDGMTKIIT